MYTWLLLIHIHIYTALFIILLLLVDTSTHYVLLHVYIVVFSIYKHKSSEYVCFHDLYIELHQCFPLDYLWRTLNCKVPLYHTNTVNSSHHKC